MNRNWFFGYLTYVNGEKETFAFPASYDTKEKVIEWLKNEFIKNKHLYNDKQTFEVT